MTLAFAQPTLKKFIALADIHFSPFIGCDQYTPPCPILNELRATPAQSWDLVFQKYADKISTNYRQDTDYFLLQSTLTELNTLAQQKPLFILMLGDFIAHNFFEQYNTYSADPSGANDAEFMKKTFQYLAYKLNQAAPRTNIYPALGNNDSYTGNYLVDPNGPFLNDTADIFAALIKDKQAREEFKDTYFNAGYYAITLPQHIRLIVLNSVLFSSLYTTSIKQKAADEQLIWLQNQLNQANQQQQSVLLAMHVPFGIDVFLDIKMKTDIVRYFIHPLFWQAVYNEKVLFLLQQYSSILIGTLPAHIHADTFQLISGKDHAHFIPSSTTPSISPIYGNNPGLKVFSFNDQTHELINFDAYFYPLNEGKTAQWKQEYNFNAIYQPNCKSCSLVQGMLNLHKDNRLMSSYKKYYAVSQNTQPLTRHKKWLPYYWCNIHNTDWESYRHCERSEATQSFQH